MTTIMIQFSDGWFDFYYCKECGKKIKLVSDKTPVKECPKCKRKIINS